VSNDDVSLPCYRVNEWQSAPTGGYSVLENPMGYHFAEAGDYTVYTWDPSSQSLTSVLTVTASESPSTLKLDDLLGYSNTASKFSLPSQIYCFAKSSEDVSSFTSDSNGIYQNIYNRVGTFEMNIL
jgi:hypothetical protein